jgi:nucleotide-binding universal stress UspA family protein
MKNSNGLPLKILWAVDAFDDLTEVQEKEVQILKKLAERQPIEIDPIYTLSPKELGVSVEIDGPWAEHYFPAVKKTLAQKLSGITIPGLNSPEILIQNRVSLRKSVETLAKYAALYSYDLIIAGSHGRSGLKRFVLGSFAEELILQSITPVMIVGSKSEQVHSGETRILVPNDFSDSRSPVFSEVFSFAKAFDAKVTLLNAIPRPVEAVMQSGVYLFTGSWVPTPIYLEDEHQKQQQAAKKVIERAKKHEIACDFIVDNQSQSIVESILSYARETRPSFIAMAAQSGPIASTLLGSVTRQVLRSAPCPVLVLRVDSK